MISFHEQLPKLNLFIFQMDFEAACVYPSAMWDNDSVYPKTESGYTFISHMNNVFVNVFNDQIFNQDVDDSVLLNIKYYNPPNLIFQHLPIKEKVKNIEVNRMGDGYLNDTLTSVDICAILKMGGK